MKKNVNRNNVWCSDSNKKIPVLGIFLLGLLYSDLCDTIPRVNKRMFSMPAQQSDSVKYTNMFKAYGAFWRRGFTEWHGTASRSEYWWNVLMNMLVWIFFLVFIGMWMGMAMGYGFDESSIVAIVGSFGSVVASLYGTACWIPRLSLRVRRLHDAGLSAGWMILYGLKFVALIAGAFSVMMGGTSYMMRGLASWGVFLFVFWFIAEIVLFVLTLLPTAKGVNPYHKFNK